MPHIQGYKIIPLNELMAQLDKERVTTILSSFSSPMNKDVELFLKQKAVTFDTQSISRTHLYCTAKLILYTQGVEMGQDIIVLGT